MADEIKCPMCGKPNPAELDVCQFCEARLKPLTDELSRSQPPIRPGDEPIDRNTADLEPVLPQWLREVREQARESVGEEPEQAPAEEEAVQQPKESADLLAGLQSQSEEKEEIPDWLAGLRSEGSQVFSEETSTEEDDLTALKSMFGEASSESGDNGESVLPGWISDIGAGKAGQQEEEEPSDLSVDQADEEEFAGPEEQPAASESEFEWAADFDADSGLGTESTEDTTALDSELPEWLKGTDEGTESEGGLPDWMGTEEPAQQSTPPFVSEESGGDFSREAEQTIDEGGLPDWLASLGEESTDTSAQEEAAQPTADVETPDWLTTLDEKSGEIPSHEAEQPAFVGDTPDWLASLGEESGEALSQETEQPAAEIETPDWLKSLDEGSGEASSQEVEQPSAEIETPDWLASLGEESGGVTPQEEAVQSTADIETPDWLTSFDGESTEPASQGEDQPAAVGDMPDWLSALGEESTDAALPQEAEQSDAVEEAPDWLSTLGESASELEGAPKAEEAFVLPTEEPAREDEVLPAFADREDTTSSTGDDEDIFSMEMPDWLSNAGTQVEEELPTPGSETQDDDLRPAELPSWVQAMRPVEAFISETEGGTVADQPVEEKGPLAGLRGVLPAVPGIRPSSKPESYSIKLRASEEQQSSAAMLEQLLAAETHPKPITTQPIVLSQRFLRWIIAVVLLVVVGGSVFSGIQINPLPTSAPLETSAALQYVREDLPANAPVLLIFDYDAAQAGELEAAAAPLIDYMLLLKHPRLGMIASNPVGAGLAESFIQPFTVPTNHNYRRGEKFINLGYLPGGAAGVLAFAKNPATTKPVSIDGELAWETPTLQGVSQLSDFAAIILLTNDVETARIWIEQTEPVRKDTRFLVISSAQSGPMILPYVESGQIDGMVTGLDGSAPIERVNNGRPGTVRRYWDAYGFGLLAALGMISLGSLWSLVSGWQERRKEQGEA